MHVTCKGSRNKPGCLATLDVNTVDFEIRRKTFFMLERFNKDISALEQITCYYVFVFS